MYDWYLISALYDGSTNDPWLYDDLLITQNTGCCKWQPPLLHIMGTDLPLRPLIIENLPLVNAILLNILGNGHVTLSWRSTAEVSTDIFTLLKLVPNDTMRYAAPRTRSFAHDQPKVTIWSYMSDCLPLKCPPFSHRRVGRGQILSTDWYPIFPLWKLHRIWLCQMVSPTASCTCSYVATRNVIGAITALVEINYLEVWKNLL